LAIKRIEGRSDQYRALLRERVYGRRNLFEWLFWPFISGGLCTMMMTGGGRYLDVKRGRKARTGRIIRGPKFVSRWRFNLHNKKGGFAIPVDNPPNLIERYITKERCVRIARDKEAHHSLVIGGTGSGKSTILREYLYNIEARGESAIVFDPEREFIEEFFDEARGDWVFNPKDDRCPYWDMPKEGVDEAEWMAIAKGFMPDLADRSSDWFLIHARAILAYLGGAYHPTTAELASWLADETELDRRLKGTVHAGTLKENAAGQRQAIIGTLNQIAWALQMMPMLPDGRRIFSVSDYVKKRQGWVFITSTAGTMDAVRPVQNLIMDLMILKLQEKALPGANRASIVIDETSLLTMPQLLNGQTRLRKWDVPLIMGMQGTAQVEKNYGEKDAETMFGNFHTSFFLWTGEERAAARISANIGAPEVQEVNESRPAFGSLPSNMMKGNFTTHNVVRPLVLASELGDLEDLNGYVKQRGRVLPIRFHPRKKRVRAPQLIERIIPSIDTMGDVELPPKVDTGVPPVAAGKTKKRTSKTERQMDFEAFGNAL
jgi:type IV secretory pathway TraG/TraD family ATPase VirD4